MILSLPDLESRLAPNQRLLGIDPGRKTIGLALSDVTRRLASPFGTIRRAKLAANAAEILSIARAEHVGGLVIGLPLSMDGTLGPAAQWDERLSTATVHEMLIEEADLGRRRRAAVVDRLAAAHILQAALDARERKEGLLF
jgi:putative Holliday junction resolvase